MTETPAAYHSSHKRSVTKSNELVEASYRLTITEQRVLLLVIAQLDPRKPPGQTDRVFRVDAQDYAQAYGIALRHAYEALSEAVRSMYERTIRTYHGASSRRGKNKDKDYRDRRWIYEASYMASEGACELRFHPDIVPMLTALHREFTTYDHLAVANLRSAYSIRLYEMLMQWRSTGEFRISIQEFRRRLCLEDKYQRQSNFRSRVLRPAVKELREKSSLELDYQEVKRGHELVELVFRFQQKPQGDLFAE